LAILPSGVRAQYSRTKPSSCRSGGVDQDRRRPEPCGDFRQGRLQLGLLAGIRADGDCRSAGGGQAARQRGGRLVGKIEDAELGARLGQGRGKNAADAAGPSGHNGHLPFQAEQAR
jgi:hypothetical protein